MDTTLDLPHWQLSSIFPSLDSADYEEAKARAKDDLKALETFMDEHKIGTQTAAEVSTETVTTFEALVERFNALVTNLSDLRAYLAGFTSTNAFDDAAQGELSSLQPQFSTLSTLSKRLTAWLGSLDAEALKAQSEKAANLSYLLERAAIDATHLLDDKTEVVVSVLGATGGGAWGKLHGELTSRSSVIATLPGREEKAYTLSELVNLQHDADPAVRKAAYEAEIELLTQNEVSYAAALNSVKGEVGELSAARGWDSPLAAAVFDNNITLASLEAMQTACREAFPDFRRYLKAKAKFLGKDALAWYDLSAPVGVGETRAFSWDEAKTFVVDTFKKYSEDLAVFAERAFAENWCDVPPRKGKRGGAFCMGVPGREESRVLLNFGGTLDDVFTIAHELGHAYHNEQMYRAGRSALQRNTPMTLAETASIFCETIVVNAMLAEASDEERLSILGQDLLGATGLVVDIHSRFILEQTVFEKRRERELSIDELKSIMLDAQASTYGEGLNEGERHSLMWAHKGHYYSNARSFYNYPYTFGYLFGLGLYKVYEAEPDGFRERYDALLSSTGLADAATLARRFGIDIESVDFWRGSLSVARERAQQFEALVETFA